MKAAFYALLLLNVAFFGWAHWVDAPVALPPAAPAHTLPTLALVQGADRGGEAASAPAPPSAAPAAAQASRASTATSPGAAAGVNVRCRSLGPFTNPTLAQQMAGRLRARGLSPIDRSVDISINDGYTVYLAAPGSDTGAQRRMLARLASAGVQDVHPVTGSQQQEPRISLGLFADQARAVRRAEQVRQLGFKPVLDIHQSTVSTHWLDLQLEPNEPTPPLGQLLQELPGGASAVTPAVAFSDCPTPAAGG
jgi:hypothetical protein